MRRAEVGAELAVDPRRIARAIFGADPAARAAADCVGLGGRDGDHPADRLAAPRQAVRAAQHLDAVDRAEHQIGEVEAAARRGGVADAHPVDDDERLLALGAADAHIRYAAERAILGDADPGQTRDQLGGGAVLGAADGGGVDDRDRGIALVGAEQIANDGDRRTIGISVLRQGRRGRGNRSERQGGFPEK